MVRVRQTYPHRVNIVKVLPRTRIALLQPWCELHDVVGRFAYVRQAFDHGTLRLPVFDELALSQLTQVSADVSYRFVYVIHPIRNAACLVGHTG